MRILEMMWDVGVWIMGNCTSFCQRRLQHIGKDCCCTIQWRRSREGMQKGVCRVSRLQIAIAHQYMWRTCTANTLFASLGAPLEFQHPSHALYLFNCIERQSLGGKHLFASIVGAPPVYTHNICHIYLCANTICQIIYISVRLQYFKSAC